jgi:basic membrane protein A and related proteins
MSGTSRRNFVKTAAVGALLLPTSLRSALPADEVLKVGVIHQGAIADTGWEYFQAQAWRSL